MLRETAAVTRDRPTIGRGEDQEDQYVFWHRQLPPLNAKMIGEHVIEATSNRIQGSLARRDELWARSYADLMKNTHARLREEIGRLGGHYAHVLDESIESRRDDPTGEAWLYGRFTYTLHD
jgi:hypothetical protein